MRRGSPRTLLLLTSAFIFTHHAGIAQEGTLTFVCRSDNDLFRIVSASGMKVARYDTPDGALRSPSAAAGILVLADGYPERTTELPRKFWDEIEERKIRLYVEYPAALPGLALGSPVVSRYERLVIVTGFASPLPPFHVLTANGLRWVRVNARSPHVVAARVAGLDSAVFGLPAATAPILFESSPGQVLVSTTRLSHFVTGRFAPKEGWKLLWQAVLRWMVPGRDLPELDWTPTVRASYSRDEELPPDVEQRSLRRGAEWFIRSKLLITPAHARALDGTVIHADSLITASPDSSVADGRLGIMEAPLSTIYQDGSQLISTVQRGDCTSESAMALAFGGKVFADASLSAVARNLLDFWFFTSDASRKERGDPQHGAYGLIAWGVGSPAWYTANYGDDNARVMLGALAASALLGEDRWDEKLMMCLLANLRTTGRLGFRGDRIDIPELSEKGWKHFFEREIVSYAPHFEAYLWACYLWAYRRTGFELFYRRAEQGIRATMQVYTDGWRWTNGLAQEKARILLPLAWLVRVKDTEEHRYWLKRALDGLLALQRPCGAIREELGLPGKGMFPPPASNEEYGTNEASLVQKNGDPISDLLYTTNFAFLGLHEAASTGDPDARAAEEKLARFLCRAQVRSDAHPSLDGGWFRAFDLKRWEAWGSNADAGWGAWAIESGWTQGWITAVLGMRQMKTSLWDLSERSGIARHFETYRRVMIPDSVLESVR